MSYELLPLEVLEQILDNVKFSDLQNAALVCRQWCLAAEVLILRKSCLTVHDSLGGSQLEGLRQIGRNHVTICLRELNMWEEIRPALDVCRQKFRPRSIRISGILADHLNRFYCEYRDWVQDVEQVRVSLDDRFVYYFEELPAKYVLNFPKAKYLNWYECLYGAGEKTVTLNAPNLQEVVIDDSLDDTSVLKLPGCTKIDKLNCTFYTKKMEDIFDSPFSNLVQLWLCIYNELESVAFLDNLYNLVKLNLSITYSKNHMRELSWKVSESICKCHQLKHLQYIIIYDISPNCTVNLSKIAQNLVNLQSLDLGNLFIELTDQVLRFPSLKTMKLDGVDFANQSASIRLDAPALRSLSISARHLRRIHCINESLLRQLDADLETLKLEEAFLAHVVPFLQRFSNVRELTVANHNHHEKNADDSFPPTVHLTVDKLCFCNVGIRLECFRTVAAWSGLKELHLDNCFIGTGEEEESVVLTNVRQMRVSRVQLSDPVSKEFPIVLRGSEPVPFDDYDSEIYFSNC
ncbi:uncharacterized protein LOC120415527 [Culex pipiens pallens]|uniref:uncharacterized protein LOC120415527 n=1 Tax=Culex pipiens pallens TaxID=42434 RepID=UPI0019546A80|nr:uncharacterized protein LOC120415527 [Culex pipiens pallens]